MLSITKTSEIEGSNVSSRRGVGNREETLTPIVLSLLPHEIVCTALHCTKHSPTSSSNRDLGNFLMCTM